jgi:hypothetical protein
MSEKGIKVGHVVREGIEETDNAVEYPAVHIYVKASQSPGGRRQRRRVGTEDFKFRQDYPGYQSVSAPVSASGHRNHHSLSPLQRGSGSGLGQVYSAEMSDPFTRSKSPLSSFPVEWGWERGV